MEQSTSNIFAKMQLKFWQIVYLFLVSSLSFKRIISLKNTDWKTEKKQQLPFFSS